MTGDPLFDILTGYLSNGAPERQVDIELLLYAAEELASDTERLTGGSGSALGFLLDRDRIHAVTQERSSWSRHLPQLTDLNRSAWRFKGEINRHVLDTVIDTPSEGELQPSWLLLLELLRERVKRLEIFTTNYDRVIKNALRYAKAPVGTGRNIERDDARLWTYMWDTDLQDYERMLSSDGKLGWLTKLHGSIDWRKGRGSEVFWGNPTPGTGDEQLLLFPGFKGNPEGLFRSFHGHFLRMVKGATVIIVIGFAFRDEAIARVLKEHRPEDCQMIALDTATEFPALSQFTRHCHIKEGFSREGIEKATEYLDHCLDVWRTRE